MGVVQELSRLAGCSRSYLAELTAVKACPEMGVVVERVELGAAHDDMVKHEMEKTAGKTVS